MTAARPLLLATLAATLIAAAPAQAARIDTDWGNDGVASTERIDGGTFAALDGGGRILVTGGEASPGVIRLTSGGRHDLTFGRFGGVTPDHPFNGLTYPFGLRRARTGRITVAALAYPLDDDDPVAFLRYTRRGGLLRALFNLPDISGEPIRGVQRRDGGAYVISDTGRIRAVRPNGLTDTRFGGGTINPFPRARFVANPPALALRQDGRLLVSIRDARGPAILRFTKRGRRDRRFGTNGRARVPFFPERIRVLRSGDVVGASGGARRLARMFRLTGRGVVRRSFGGSRGVALGRPTRTGTSVDDIAEDARGRLYALAFDPNRLNSGVQAFSAAGTRLASFGPRGARFLPTPSEFERHVGADLLPDGRGGLLVIGDHDLQSCDDRQDFDCDFYSTLAVWRIRL